MFKMEFKTDNAAFQDGNRELEIIALLHQVGNQVERGATGGSVRDSNGNTVGSWSLKS